MHFRLTETLTPLRGTQFEKTLHYAMAAVRIAANALSKARKGVFYSRTKLLRIHSVGGR